MRLLHPVDSTGESHQRIQRARAKFIAGRQLGGSRRQLAFTYETGEVVSTQATGTRQDVWDLWDVWKPHRIPSSVSRLNRQIDGWLRALGAASRCDPETEPNILRPT